MWLLWAAAFWVALELVEEVEEVPEVVLSLVLEVELVEGELEVLLVLVLVEGLELELVELLSEEEELLEVSEEELLELVSEVYSACLMALSASFRLSKSSLVN